MDPLLGLEECVEGACLCIHATGKVVQAAYHISIGTGKYGQLLGNPTR